MDVHIATAVELVEKVLAKGLDTDERAPIEPLRVQEPALRARNLDSVADEARTMLVRNPVNGVALWHDP
jgi:hypothetical protein